MTVNQMDLTQKVIKNMEEKLGYHELLARYTKHSVKLRKHVANIQLWKETIADYKNEYGLK